MEFLRAILTEELYKQLETAINAHNGNEANRDKQIKLANLGGGEYVGKGKYDALNDMLSGKQAELDSANNLIAEMRKSAKGNEDMQGKIAAYDSQVQQLQAQLRETKIKSAVKVELLSAKANDVDYLTYKLNEKLKADGKALELDENENIKGWADYLSSLKTQFPGQFASEGQKNIIENKLPNREPGERAVTKEQFNGMSYEQRVQLKQENEKLYKQLTGKE